VGIGEFESRLAYCTVYWASASYLANKKKSAVSEKTDLLIEETGREV